MGRVHRVGSGCNRGAAVVGQLARSCTRYEQILRTNRSSNYDSKDQAEPELRIIHFDLQSRFGLLFQSDTKLVMKPVYPIVSVRLLHRCMEQNRSLAYFCILLSSDTQVLTKCLLGAEASLHSSASSLEIQRMASYMN